MGSPHSKTKKENQMRAILIIIATLVTSLQTTEAYEPLTENHAKIWELIKKLPDQTCREQMKAWIEKGKVSIQITDTGRQSAHTLSVRSIDYGTPQEYWELQIEHSLLYYNTLSKNEWFIALYHECQHLTHRFIWKWGLYNPPSNQRKTKEHIETAFETEFYAIKAECAFNEKYKLGKQREECKGGDTTIRENLVYSFLAQNSRHTDFLFKIANRKPSDKFQPPKKK
jgi:hypothetical protein